MREILFRIIVDGKKYYWGDINNQFLGLPTFPIYSYEEIIKKSCQYTGLKDKNGVKIFENDILCINNGFEEDLANLVVKIKNGIVGVRNILDGGVLDDDIFVLGNISNYGQIFNPNLEDYEIIGNIYENPDLLNKE